MKSAEVVNKYRVKTGPMASDDSSGMNGAFMVPCGRVVLGVVASDGRDWEQERLPLPKFDHVSVSLPARCPTWEEMEFIKRLFFRPEEMAVQYHVPIKRHINRNNHCLHIWRPIGVEFPMPPEICV